MDCTDAGRQHDFTSRAALAGGRHVVAGTSTTVAGQFNFRGFLWTAAKGMVDLYMEIWQHVPIAAVKADVSTALFTLSGAMPLGLVLSAVATLLVLIFFVTSGDSAVLKAVQTATIVFALPFAFVIMLMVLSLWRAIREDWDEEEHRERELRRRMRQMIAK